MTFACSYIGDCLVPRACADFVQEYGTEIVQRNLCRNVLVHLTNLCDFGLIRADVLSRTTMQLFRLRAKMFADGLLCKATPVPVQRSRLVSLSGWCARCFRRRL